ncbi:MAG: DUF502 domain-containing protein [Candidatus Coatesbacteria bacterium]|nr:DUF502 domain-containing protein [Candidatus Coatesbacteria bacterium]
MVKPSKSRIKRILAAGALVLVPVSLTFFLVYKLVQWTDDLLDLALPIPRAIALPGLGLIFLAALTLLVGLLATNLVGKKVVAFGERILESIPVISSIYSGAKTLVEAFTLPSSSAFRQVVLVEYPRRGMWVLGFVTKEVADGESGIGSGKKLNLFIPTSPNPTSGMVVVIERDDAIYLDLTVKEAVEFIVSGGVLYPSSRTVEDEKAKRRPPQPLTGIPIFRGNSARALGREKPPDPRSI